MAPNIQRMIPLWMSSAQFPEASTRGVTCTCIMSPTAPQASTDCKLQLLLAEVASVFGGGGGGAMKNM